IATGSPSSQPGCWRAAGLKSLACSRAASKNRIGNALIFGSTASMRDTAASTISSGETSPRRRLVTACVAVSRHNSLDVTRDPRNVPTGLNCNNTTSEATPFASPAVERALWRTARSCRPKYRSVLRNFLLELPYAELSPRLCTRRLLVFYCQFAAPPEY